MTSFKQQLKDASEAYASSYELNVAQKVRHSYRDEAIKEIIKIAAESGSAESDVAEEAMDMLQMRSSDWNPDVRKYAEERLSHEQRARLWPPPQPLPARRPVGDCS